MASAASSLREPLSAADRARPLRRRCAHGGFPVFPCTPPGSARASRPASLRPVTDGVAVSAQSLVTESEGQESTTTLTNSTTHEHMGSSLPTATFLDMDTMTLEEAAEDARTQRLYDNLVAPRQPDGTGSVYMATPIDVPRAATNSLYMDAPPEAQPHASTQVAKATPGPSRPARSVYLPLPDESGAGGRSVYLDAPSNDPPPVPSATKSLPPAPVTRSVYMPLPDESGMGGRSTYLALPAESYPSMEPPAQPPSQPPAQPPKPPAGRTQGGESVYLRAPEESGTAAPAPSYPTRALDPAIARSFDQTAAEGPLLK